MVNQDGSEDNPDLERMIVGHQALVKQDGELVEVAIKAKTEALKAKASRPTSPATQIIQAAQTPISKREVRDIFKPLEELVQQGPGSVGGVEVFGAKVLTLISSAVKQIYPDLGVDKWDLRDDGGWSNDKLYFCINCDAVQGRYNKERLTTLAEYVLIRDAFRLGKILISQDTSSCSGVRTESAKGGAYQAPQKNADTAKPRLEEINELMKSIGGEWHERGEGDNKNGWWNTKYLICPFSEKAYSRLTGEEAPGVNATKIMSLLPLSIPENLCPSHALYKQVAPTLPEEAKMYALTSCSVCKAPKK